MDDVIDEGLPRRQLHRDRGVLIELIDDAHQPIDGEPSQLSLPNPRKIRCRHTGFGMGGPHG